MTISRTLSSFAHRLGAGVALWRDRTRQIAALAHVPATGVGAIDLATVSPGQLANWLADKDLAADWKSLDTLRAELRIANIMGGVNAGDQRALYTLVRALKPKHILEVGTHVGCSTINIALGAADYACDFTTVDIRDVNDPIDKPWIAFGADRSPAKLMTTAGCAGRVKFVVANSIDFLSAAAPAYDFIFLDGCHDAATVYLEASLALRRVNPGGAIVLHDYYPEGKPLWSNGVVLPGVVLAMDRLVRECPDLAVLPLGKLPWPTKLNSQMTSLALICHR
jgi:predicted O-methyltransferase YrrM